MLFIQCRKINEYPLTWTIPKKVSNQSLSSNERVLIPDEETLVNYNTSHQQRYPHVCNFTNNTFIVTWVSDHLDFWDPDIYVKIFNSTGHNQTGDVQVNSYIGGYRGSPFVCALTEELFVVGWNGPGVGDGNGVFIKIFNSTCHNQTNDIKVNSYTSGNQYGSSICSLSNNSFIVVWNSEGQDGSGYGVYMKLFNSSGIPQSGDIKVNTYVLNSQGSASASCFPNGTFVVTWVSWEQDGDRDGVFMKIFNSTCDNQTDDIQVNFFTANDQSNPSVSCDVNNTFVIVWDSINQTGEDNDVYAKIFNSSGQNITDTILVNVRTDNSQRHASVSCFANGSFVVSWESDHLDNFNFNIYSRLFNSTGHNQTKEKLVSTDFDRNQFYCSSTCLTNNSFLVIYESWSGGDGPEIFFIILTIDRYNEIPFSNNLVYINTLTNGTETINWILCDDVGPGKYRVWSNCTINNFYVWINWTDWSNNTNLQVPINRSLVGRFNYTIEYFDNEGAYGIPDMLWIDISDPPIPPEPPKDPPDFGTINFIIMNLIFQEKPELPTLPFMIGIFGVIVLVIIMVVISKVAFKDAEEFFDDIELEVLETLELIWDFMDYQK